MQYGQTVKQHAPETTPIGELLNGIADGTFYTHAYDAFKWNGFEHCVVGFSVARVLGISLDFRYSIQTVNIPSNQRGNLFQFAGKKVEVICTVIGRGQATIAMWVKTIQ